jgi:putative inorganic carbon (HCO3(-)) transporter
MTGLSGTRRRLPGTSTLTQPTHELAAVGMAILVTLTALLAGIMAGDNALLAVAGASAAFLAIAIVLYPDVATLATIAILWSNTAVILVKFHGVPAFAAAFVPMLLVVPLARDLIVRRLPVVAPPQMGWMVVLLFIHIFSSLFSTDLVRSWNAVTVFIFEGIGLYFLLINVIRTSAMLRNVTWVLLIAGTLITIPSILQVAAGAYGNNYLGFAQAANATIGPADPFALVNDVQRRVTGPIGEVNRYAQILLMLVPLGIFRFTGEKRQVLRWAAAVMTAIITFGVVLTYSRGAVVGLIALIGCLALLRMIKLRYIAVILLAMGIVLAALPQYAERVASLSEIGAFAGDTVNRGTVGGSFLSRLTETTAAALVAVDHPLVGVGPDMFPIYYEQYAKQVGLLVRNDATREAHDLYVGIAAELGIPGLIVFLIICVLTLRMLLQARRRSVDRRPDLEQLTTPYLLALITYAVTGLFLHLSFTRYFFLMLAVATAAAVITLREMDELDADEAERPDVPIPVAGGAQRAVTQSV